MRTRVFLHTYPTYARVGGTSRQAGETVLKLILSSHHQQRRISELECSLQHYSWKKILLERSFCKILQYSIQILEFFIYFERCKKGWRAFLTRNLSLKHFNESNKQLKVKTHFHDLKNEHQRPQFSDPIGSPVDIFCIQQHLPVSRVSGPALTAPASSRAASPSRGVPPLAPPPVPPRAPPLARWPAPRPAWRRRARRSSYLQAAAVSCQYLLGKVVTCWIAISLQLLLMLQRNLHLCTSLHRAHELSGQGQGRRYTKFTTWQSHLILR